MYGDAFALSGRFFIGCFSSLPVCRFYLLCLLIIDEGIIAVGRLEEVTLRTHGLRTAVAF